MCMDEFIMVVDDTLENLRVLGNILRENGYKIALVQSGKEAFTILENMIPMVIFLDVMMPDMDGYEVLQRLKNSPATMEIPVIMVTAKSDAEDIDSALSMGAIDYIKKPVNKIELLARLRTTIKLREKELALQTMLQSKDDFIHMVAHDLRTPFASISGFADMLINDESLKNKMNSEHKEYLKIIIDSSTFLVEYFNKLLNWASIESKGLSVNTEKINLKGVIQTTQLLFSSKLKEKEQTFINKCKDDLVIKADGALFQQIINNLISNAIKFSPDKSEISIITEELSDKIEITIRDSGSGISGVTPEELFTKSFHKSTRGTKGEKGTGVGLHICKVIADAHAFGLTYKPAPQKGTDFMISIPLS